jgi:bifunctional UDP-N-acetylglucosamine pyrophosphorylase/glucosamine-1-phosphate N-acetyltransferase
VDSLTQLGFDKIVLVAGPFADEVRGCFRDLPHVRVLTDDAPKGAAYSLLCAKDEVDEDFLLLYGDTIVDTDDLRLLRDTFLSSGDNTALVGEIKDRSSEHIGCTVADGFVTGIYGHSRDDSTHCFAAFALRRDIFDVLPYNGCRFTGTDVGMMSPVEGYLEITLADELKRGTPLRCVCAASEFFDIDRPWDILYANTKINEKRCAALRENELAPGASIDPTAVLHGYVRLGKNSRIGHGVIVEGNLIVGDDCEIINGAIVGGSVVIGDRSKVRNYCYIAPRSTVGSECIVSHAAELDGMILDRVYLYHYMEWNGVIGVNTDLGAATVCGSLRFDDSITLQRVKGRREFHNGFGDAVFLGDYCRTGVNAILMPGVKVGVYSVVGAGVVLTRDVADNTLIYAQQTLTEKPWGPEKYGW